MKSLNHSRAATVATLSLAVLVAMAAGCGVRRDGGGVRAASTSSSRSEARVYRAVTSGAIARRMMSLIALGIAGLTSRGFFTSRHSPPPL